MYRYDSRNWIRALALHQSDTFRKLLPMVLVVGLWTYVIEWTERVWLGLDASSPLGHVTVMHSLLGFAISMLLVFRTNTAYDRWWEGRKLWGQLVNASRNLAVKVDAFVPDDAVVRAFYARLIPMFAHELRLHLQLEKTRLELDTDPHPEIPDFDRSKHVPMQVASLMMRRARRLMTEGRITGEQLIILDRELALLLDICGACERIKNTPIPYSYSSFIKKFIVIYVGTLPMSYVFTLDDLAVPVVMFVFYVLASLEIIAEEIEDPFGKDANDLPMERLAAKIKGNIDEVLT